MSLDLKNNNVDNKKLHNDNEKRIKSLDLDFIIKITEGSEGIELILPNINRHCKFFNFISGKNKFFFHEINLNFNHIPFLELPILIHKLKNTFTIALPYCFKEWWLLLTIPKVFMKREYDPSPNYHDLKKLFFWTIGRIHAPTEMQPRTVISFMLNYIFGFIGVKGYLHKHSWLWPKLLRKNLKIISTFVLCMFLSLELKCFHVWRQ